jgi:hypothetical protein
MLIGGILVEAKLVSRFVGGGQFVRHPWQLATNSVPGRPDSLIRS